MLDTVVIIFIVLKLTGLIAWSWWWVLSPWITLISLILIMRLLLRYCDKRKNPKVTKTTTEVRK